MTKRAFITGIGGQDGGYLAEVLLRKGYHVFGLVRYSATQEYLRVAHIKIQYPDRLTIIEGDLLEDERLRQIIMEIMPDEIYNLAAQSHVGYSEKAPLTTFMMDARAVWVMLEILRSLKRKKRIKFYQASTSELFGGDPGTEPQDESTPMMPHSPYAVAKLAAYHYVRYCREACGIFACNGILFNHESPWRGKDFVTRKITIGAARIKAGLQDCIELGNLDAKRDWGFAGDYCVGMHQILQHNKPDDFVLATGQTQTVRRFANNAFATAGLPILWKGDKLNEVAITRHNSRVVIRINPEFLRAKEVRVLLGNPAKARKVLHWKPRVGFEGLIKMMVEADLELVEAGKL